MITKSKKLVVDLDGTICSQEKTGSYHQAMPMMDVIRRVNDLWTQGWDITVFTARGMQTCKGDVQEIEKEYRKMTEKWLKDNRVCYHRLLFGKPDADFYVDDKAMGPGTFVNDAW